MKSSPISSDLSMDNQDEHSFENELERLLRTRHSCRAFKPDVVAQAMLERVLLMAQRTASWCNAQPWKAYVVSGKTLKMLKDSLTEYVTEEGQQAPELTPPVSYTDERLARRRQSGFALYGALGIQREDKEARASWHRENFRFFGAPHVVVITVADELQEYGAVDAGGYISTLLLAAESLKLGACPQAAPALYSPAVRDVLDLPTDERIVGTVALGYPDTTSPAYAFRTPRASLEESVMFFNE